MPIQPPGRWGLVARDWVLWTSWDGFGVCGGASRRIVDVVEASDLSMGAIYRYFDNKEDLFPSVIADLHAELFQTGRTTISLESDPRQALYEANHGYLQLYYDNRHLMRTFIEYTAMEPRFLKICWEMRERHARRFAAVVRRIGLNEIGINEIDGVAPEVTAQAMASLVEQSAFVWFAHEALLKTPVDVDTAANVTTRAWFLTFFTESGTESEPTASDNNGSPV